MHLHLSYLGLILVIHVAHATSGLYTLTIKILVPPATVNRCSVIAFFLYQLLHHYSVDQIFLQIHGRDLKCSCVPCPSDYSLLFSAVLYLKSTAITEVSEGREQGQAPKTVAMEKFPDSWTISSLSMLCFTYFLHALAKITIVYHCHIVLFCTCDVYCKSVQYSEKDPPSVVVPEVLVFSLLHYK